MRGRSRVRISQNFPTAVDISRLGLGIFFAQVWEGVESGKPRERATRERIVDVWIS